MRLSTTSSCRTRGSGRSVYWRQLQNVAIEVESGQKSPRGPPPNSSRSLTCQAVAASRTENENREEDGGGGG